MSLPRSLWPTVPLGSVLKVKNGRNQREVEVPFGRYPILATGGEIGRTNTPLYSKPSVLIGRKGTINRPQFQESPFWTVDTLFYTEVSARADARYLYYLCTTIDWMSLNEATGIPSLTGRRIESVEVLLPSLDEQQHISAVLKDADELIASLERLIAKKRNIKQGLMQELLTGRTRLPGFAGAWATRTLGEVARIKTGSRNNQDKVAGGRYPFFVRSATVERIDSYSYNCEAILVPGEGGVGSIFHYVNGKFEVHQRVYKISDFVADASGKFIFQYMREFFGSHALGNTVKATVDSLRLPTFTGFELTVPPTREEQDAIAQVLLDADGEIAALERRLESARAIKQGMLQELLTGRTRLVTEAAA